MSKVILGFCVLLVAIVGASATGAPPGPYVGQQQRDIKALSSDDIQGYLTGKGMGLAKAAELNRYPGPAHVLELAEPLGLDAEQKRRTEAIFEAMRAEAVRLGMELIAQERKLDRMFAGGDITGADLQAVLERIGRLQALVRRTHLQAHIAQREVLTPAQIDLYQTLRGYAPHAGHVHHH